MKMIEAHHLGKKYQKRITGAGEFTTLRDRLTGACSPQREDFWALQDLNLTIQQGEVWGIVGRNGAGKSTFFKIISRITAPTTGELILRGRVSSLLEVGTGFHPELSGRENIYLNGAILGMSRQEVGQHFSEIVDFAGIHKFLDDPVKYYSSGMYMRLGFAIAAFLSSEIIIIDEVLSVGDSAFRQRCLEKIEQLVHDEGRTVLIVSHSLESVQKLTDHTLWLDHGQLRDIGPTAQVLKNYKKMLSQKE